MLWSEVDMGEWIEWLYVIVVIGSVLWVGVISIVFIFKNWQDERYRQRKVEELRRKARMLKRERELAEKGK